MLSVMVLIFCLSSETAAESSKTSGGFSKAVISFFYPPFKDFTELRQTEIISALSFWVRKGAHFTLYGILGFFAQMTLISYRGMSLFLRNVFAAAISFLYSVSDEIHQTFIVGRSGELRDVFVDTGGAVTFILFSTLIMYLNKRIYGLVRKKG